MGIINTRNTIRPTVHALEYACASLGQNVVSSRLERSIEDIRAIAKKIKDMGQSRHINLTHRYDEGKIVIALYAGDGIVTKIIPPDFFDETEPVMSMPAITSELVDTGKNEYLINTYPWLAPSPVTSETVITLQNDLDQLGMNYIDGDNHPRNIHIMPDRMGTLVGIDSDMYRVDRDGPASTQDMQRMWREYVESMFPVYKVGYVPRQTDDTDMNFISAHDPDTGIVTFDPAQDNPVIYHEDTPDQKQIISRSDSRHTGFDDFGIM